MLVINKLFVVCILKIVIIIVNVFIKVVGCVRKFIISVSLLKNLVLLVSNVIKKFGVKLMFFIYWFVFFSL